MAKAAAALALFIFICIGWGLAADRLGQIKLLEKQLELVERYCK